MVATNTWVKALCAPWWSSCSKLPTIFTRTTSATGISSQTIWSLVNATTQVTAENILSNSKSLTSMLLWRWARRTQAFEEGPVCASGALQRRTEASTATLRLTPGRWVVSCTCCARAGNPLRNNRNKTTFRKSTLKASSLPTRIATRLLTWLSSSVVWWWWTQSADFPQKKPLSISGWEQSPISLKSRNPWSKFNSRSSKATASLFKGKIPPIHRYLIMKLRPNNNQ